MIDFNQITIDGLTYNLFTENIERYQCDYVTSDRRVGFPYWTYHQRCRFICEANNNILLYDGDCDDDRGISASLMYSLIDKFATEVENLSDLHNSLIIFGVFEDAEGYATIYKNVLLSGEYKTMNFNEFLDLLYSNEEVYRKCSITDYEFGEIKQDE